MIKLVITGHGEFAKGMFDVIKFIIGEVEELEKVCFDNSDMDTYSETIEALIKDSKDGTLIFTDLIGGTPFRISTLLCTKYENMSILTGANIPMIIEAIIKRESMTVKELAESIAETGKNSIHVFDKQILDEKSKKYTDA